MERGVAGTGHYKQPREPSKSSTYIQTGTRSWSGTYRPLLGVTIEALQANMTYFRKSCDDAIGAICDTIYPSRRTDYFIMFATALVCQNLII